MIKSTFAIATVAFAFAALASDGKVDFSKVDGRIRPELHSAGFCPSLTIGHKKQAARKGGDVGLMNIHSVRTHDWALLNGGQRVCDTHFIFPLMKLDPKDPTNYYFKPTDELLKRAIDEGHEVFYRLGTSIEHTGDVFFNAAVPEDYDKYAEVCAGIVRHYTKGWADGFKWNIKYWEIWNEPDGIDNMWRVAGEKGLDRVYMRDLYIKFFITVFKRLKSEFPEIKVGGPALCNLSSNARDFLDALLAACKEAGVKPDFVSWHGYERDPNRLVEWGWNGKWFVQDKYGMKDVELIINEWHYLPYKSAWEDYNGHPSRRALLWEGTSRQNGIDSAAFTLATLCRFQKSAYDQAFYYGCGNQGNWGYMNQDGSYNKCFYALVAFGNMVKSCADFVAVEPESPSLTLFGGKAKDGNGEHLIVVDYLGKGPLVEIEIAGVEAGHRPSVRLVDERGDAVNAEFEWKSGKLTLFKRDLNSAFWYVDFEPTR